MWPRERAARTPGIREGTGPSRAWATRDKSGRGHDTSQTICLARLFSLSLSQRLSGTSHLQRLRSQPHHAYRVPSTLRDLFQALIALQLDCVCDR